MEDGNLEENNKIKLEVIKPTNVKIRVREDMPTLTVFIGDNLQTSENQDFVFSGAEFTEDTERTFEDQEESSIIISE